MKTQNNTSSKSLVTFLLYALRGLFLWYVLHVVLLVIDQIWPTAMNDGTPGASLPVVFKATGGGNLRLPNTTDVSWFDLYQAQGVIVTNGLPDNVLYIASVGVLLNYVCILLMIHLICKMLINARKGNFLVSKNAIRLRYIALLNIAVLLIDKLFVIISSSYLSDKLELPGIKFTSFNSYSFSYWKYIFLYLFLLIIAEAFRLGVQLKEENDLTI